MLSHGLSEDSNGLDVMSVGVSAAENFNQKKVRNV